MREGKIYKKNLNETIKDSLKNTLNFENCSFFSEYDYEDKLSKVGTSLGLCYDDNYVVNTIIPYLKSNSKISAFSEEDERRYSYRPMKLSYDTYDTIDYWWIILCVNGYLNPQEFHSFTQLILPTKSEIESILDKEVYTNNKIGMIPKETDR